MSFRLSQEEHFQNILVEHTTGQETTDELVEICDQAGLFEDDPYIDNAIRDAKRRKINRLARMGGWTDGNGEPLELVNVVRPVDGKKVHYTIQLTFATFEDHKQLVEDRIAKSGYFHKEAVRYYEIGCEKFGRKFQRLFQFD